MACMAVAAVPPAASALPTTWQGRSTVKIPPPPGGHFRVVPPGRFGSLPGDTAAATKVHRSAWEPRPANAKANATMPPPGVNAFGYSGMLYHAAVFGRVTGHFKGTTDEIIQWAAVKWGLPDEVIRAEAVQESNWYQRLRTRSGAPVNGSGYGDFGDCGGGPPPSGYGNSGPASFGLMQVKWCMLKDPGAPGYGGWPWTERSTAFAVDLYGAVIRGCYEGWDTWLGGSYRAGDLWGCVGRWYAGRWYSTDAQAYINRVQHFYNNKPWLTWSG